MIPPKTTPIGTNGLDAAGRCKVQTPANASGNKY
jgi:hypothetical protein